MAVTSYGASEAMRAAFTAGFEASGEGFNGECVHPDYYGPDRDGAPLDAELDKLFLEWREAWHAANTT